MNPLLRCLCYLLAFNVCHVGLSWADEFVLGPQDGILVLKNGSTLEGRITKAGDRYLVTFGEAGQVRVPVTDVLRVCRNLEEVYAYKQRAGGQSLAHRLEMAQWCLQQGLFAHASEQLLFAEATHGAQPEIERLHQRLLLMGAADTAAAAGLPTKPSGVAPASFERSSRPVPGETVEQFTSAVQPLLLNRCMAGGCHSPRGSSTYVLARPPLGHLMTRRITERNLVATLEHLPALLERSRSAHGGAISSPLSDLDEVQYATLQAWVESIHATRPTPPRVAPASEILFQATLAPPAAGTEDPPALADSTSPERSHQPEAAVAPTSAARPDPFDPGVFNRRYHPPE